MKLKNAYTSPEPAFELQNPTYMKQDGTPNDFELEGILTPRLS